MQKKSNKLIDEKNFLIFVITPKKEKSFFTDKKGKNSNSRFTLATTFGVQQRCRSAKSDFSYLSLDGLVK